MAWRFEVDPSLPDSGKVDLEGGMVTGGWNATGKLGGDLETRG